MTYSIIIYSNLEEKKIFSFFSDVLSKFGTVVCAQVQKLSQREGESERQFALVEYHVLPRIEARNAIVVIAGSAPFDCSVLLPDTTVIIDSSNTSAIACLKNIKCRVLTCGLSDKDTFTFSSIEESQAVVSLQRQIDIPGFAVIEPMDIRIEKSAGDTVFSVLSCGAVLTLTIGEEIVRMKKIPVI